MVWVAPPRSADFRYTQGGVDGSLERILFTDAEIAACVGSLAERLSADFAGQRPLMVGILSGSFVFLSDLVRAMSIPLEVDFMAVSSYGHGTQSSGVVRILKDLSYTIDGRDVVVVEDIVDTGLTLRYLVDNLRTRAPRSVQTCCLLDKRSARQVEVEIAYRGMECPDAFVVGYGLDYAGLYRNLPYIGVLKPEVIGA